jgi:dimethylhistidine N-methyltransferase
VVELGSGSGAKTTHVLRSLAQRQQGPLDYYPIDVSASALECCRRELFTVAQVHPVQATFVDGVRAALSRIPPHHRLLLLFLGSTIGNFSREAAGELLAELRAVLPEGGVMLIGADLVKPADRLLLAYDDPAGVTAAFNLNLLARINRELGANFDLRKFRHQARYGAAQKRVEMHLVSQTSHRVEIPGAACEVSFAAGESIWTESSHKYDCSDLEEMARAGGFRTLQTWTDQEWPFAESLWQAV